MLIMCIYLILLYYIYVHTLCQAGKDFFFPIHYIFYLILLSLNQGYFSFQQYFEGEFVYFGFTNMPNESYT